ncbi:hypothetical protein AAMO2058_000642900 [Amorphochlora amoebiformis]
MFEDVVSIDSKGVPLNAEGEAAKICEYSNTPVGAIRQALKIGIVNFIRDPAPFQQLTLHDYQDGRSAFGIYRVVDNITPKDRDSIVQEAKNLMLSFKPYDIIFRNCEHAAWGLDAGTKRWISPQVPWFLYNFLRLVVHLIGCILLYHLETLRGISPDLRVEGWGFYENATVIVYNLFTTIPVGLQVLVSLVRSAVRLTERKEKLGEMIYFFLLAKEVARAVISGGMAILMLALLPRIVWSFGCIVIASFFVMTSYFLSDVVFNVSAQLIMRWLNSSGTGVPVAVFASQRELQRQSKLPRTSFWEAFSPRLTQLEWVPRSNNPSDASTTLIRERSKSCPSSPILGSSVRRRTLRIKKGKENGA